MISELELLKNRLEEANRIVKGLQPDNPLGADAMSEISKLISKYEELARLPGDKKSHVKVNGLSYYMDGYLKKNLTHLMRSVDNKWDGVVVVDGMEGSAKTTLTSACAHFCSNGTYSLKDLFFTVEQFEEWVDNAPPGAAGHWDEFVFGGLSEEALSRIQIALIKKMTLIRKKRLFIFLVIPYIFMLRQYFAIARSRALIHVYSPDGISRGYFKFYDYHQKRNLYFKSKKNWAYDQPFSFQGRFVNYEGLFWDPEEYDTKKEAAIKSLSVGDSAERWRERVIGAVKYLWEFEKENYPNLITQANIADWFGVSDRQLRRWLTGNAS